MRAQHSRALATVSDSLSTLLPDVLCLYREEIHTFRGVDGIRRFPLFGTPYIFARWETADPYMWNAVRWTRGVAEIVGGATPAVVPLAEIESWRALAGLEDVVDLSALIRSRFEVGEEVCFSYGAFEHKFGEFVGFRGNAAGVKTALLGRETIVYVPVNLVYRVSSSLAGGDPAFYSGGSQKPRGRPLRPNNRRKQRRKGVLGELVAHA